ncbi:MAG: hypothetical protein K5989_12780 [Lachnospiraceae bacterium]|nr:hypothetical protein [Lachnospiraceae bacterium]
MKKRRIFIGVFLITIIVACLPLFTVNCINGHDIEYHLLRIEALKEGILHGHPFLRVNMLFFCGEGYASSLFYPDFLLYLPALLRVFGLGINGAYHVFVAFCIICGFISCYFSVRYITGQDMSALLSAVIFTLCQYHIDDIYTRSAVGEYTAFIFFPLVIAGLFDLMYRDLKKPWILGAGMAGVLLCHTLTTFFSLILCVFALICSVKRLRQEPKILLRLFLTAVAVLLMTAFYWLPMLEQLNTTTFAYVKSKFDLDYEKLLLRDVFQNELPGMGISVFLLVLPRLFIKARGEERKDGYRFADFCLIFGLLFTLGTTGLFPWKRAAKYLNFVQFPWRLFIVASSLLAIAAGIYIVIWAEEMWQGAGEKLSPLITLIVLAIMISSAVGNLNRIDEGYYSYSDDYFEYGPHTKTVIGGEWLPITVTDREKLGDDADLAYTDGGEIEIERIDNKVAVEGLTGEEAYVDVPYIYYYGYKAINAENGEQLPLDGSGENGRARIYPGGAKAFTVYYGGTLLQTISSWLSFIAILGGLAFVCFHRKWNFPMKNLKKPAEK